MTKDKAIARVAGKLALNSYEHVQAAIKDANLSENTREALELNQEAADALGFGQEYAAAFARMVNGG